MYTQQEPAMSSSSSNEVSEDSLLALSCITDSSDEDAETGKKEGSDE
jgi:hypothetical protein